MDTFSFFRENGHLRDFCGLEFVKRTFTVYGRHNNTSSLVSGQGSRPASRGCRARCCQVWKRQKVSAGPKMSPRDRQKQRKEMEPRLVPAGTQSGNSYFYVVGVRDSTRAGVMSNSRRILQMQDFEVFRKVQAI